MKTHRILSFEQLCQLELAKISYRYVNDVLPIRLQNLFEHREIQYDTRNSGASFANKHGSVLYNKCFLVKSPSNWLRLLTNIKNKKSIKSFKSSIKMKLLN